MNKSVVVSQDYQLVNAKYKLNTSELKFILVALTKLDSRSDVELDELTITLNEVESLLDKKKNETHLKTFAKKLMSKPLEIKIEDGFEIYNWFSKIKYQGGIFTVRIDKDLKPYLLELKERFVAYNLKYIIPLTSTYSVRIYQLLKEYEKLKIRYFDLVELQELLQVPKSYNRYSQFKDKVLKVAERELKEHTDIYFTLEEEKEGRKVTRLVFKIHSNLSSTKAPQLFTAEATELPKSVELIMGTYDFKSEKNFYTAYSDGSFHLEKIDGSKMFFKSEKQLEYFASNPDSYTFK